MSGSDRPTLRMRIAGLGGMLLAGSILAGCSFFPPDLPEQNPTSKTVWLDQNWSDDARFWFHHASQGTSTMPVPYAWFIALEQPGIRLFGEPKMLADPAYMARFGFISSPRTAPQGGTSGAAGYGYGSNAGAFNVAYDPKSFPGNPDGLPVGFARTPGYLDPTTGNKVPDQIGLTCAACHTGQMNYRGTNIRIDGAPATTDLGKFRTSLGLALAYTVYVPGRFDRFADRVLGPNHSDAERDQLKKTLKAFLKAGEATLQQMADGMKGSVEEGFMRLDALNRIGTQVFFTDLVGAKKAGFDPSANIAPNNAPVNYPATWSTSWFDWVQYDASIRQPMVRNAGEAMGVSAKVNLTDPSRPLYASSIPIKELFQMEELLAGPDPQHGTKGFKGLASPAWPEDILGPIDRTKAERGRELYTQHCATCHRPAVNDPSGRFWDAAYWTTPNAEGERYYKVPVIPLSTVGTDPAQAEVLATRMVKVPAYLGVPEPEPVNGTYCEGKAGTTATEAPFGWALAVVTGKVIERWYDENGVPAEERAHMDGYRRNCIQAPAGYKARPLDGVWATAPFLHNGSVPSLHDLLLPAAERPKSFCLGSLEFDPTKVGYDTSCKTGTNKIDTSVKGNLNIGHSFQDGPRGAGVIGPAFSEADRNALVEYLKTL